MTLEKSVCPCSLFPDFWGRVKEKISTAPRNTGTAVKGSREEWTFNTGGQKINQRPVTGPRLDARRLKEERKYTSGLMREK